MLRSFIAVVSAFVLIMGGVMIATVIATRVMLGSFIPAPGVQPTRTFLMVNLAYSLAFAVSGGHHAHRSRRDHARRSPWRLAVFLVQEGRMTEPGR